MAQAAVVLEGVTRAFGPHRALDGLDMTAPSGQVTVLVGPNGAGKTTALRTMTGALAPGAGSVLTLGASPGPDVRRRIGVVAAKPALYDRLTGRDNLRYAARLYGLDDDVAVEPAAARFGIDDALAQRVGGYSTGMKTRLALARATLHDPDLLLLDEPTSGLDPESAHQVLHHVRDLARVEGKTVVVSTHLLLEAEGLADHVVFLERGVSVAEGSPDELAAGAIPTRPGVTIEAVGREPVSYDCELDDVPDLVARLVADGARIVRVEPRGRPTLEQIYFALRREDRSR